MIEIGIIDLKEVKKSQRSLVMRYRYYLHGILSMLFIVFLNGCTKPADNLYPPDPNSSDNKSIYVVNHGLHAGIILPQKDAAPYMKRFDDYKSARYLEIGWGDEIYYQAKEKTTYMTLRALFWPTDSVLHVAAFDKDPKVYFSEEEVVELELSNAGFVRLVKFIDNSFTPNEEGKTTRLKDGQYGTSGFYRAKGKFHLFNTCNTWSAETIRTSGFPINTFCTFTGGNIIEQLK